MKKRLLLILIFVAILILSTLIIVAINIKSTPVGEQNTFEKIFQKEDTSNTPQTTTNDNQQTPSTENQTESQTSSGGGGGGGGSTTSDTTTQPDVQLTCESRQIHYSLKDFNENFACQQNSSQTCTKMLSTCSVYTYNIDTDSNEDFIIKYYIQDSAKNELNSTIIQKRVNTDKPQKFEATFLNEDQNGIPADLSCEIEVQQVPNKQVCY